MLNKFFCFIICCFLSPHVFSAKKCRTGFSGKLPAALALPLEELELSVRATNALRAEAIYDLGDLAVRTREEVSIIPGIGKKTLEEIEKNLSEKELRFGMNIDWPLSPEQREAMIEQYKQESSPSGVSSMTLFPASVSPVPASKEAAIPSVLTPKEEKVLRMFFGLGGEQSHSLKQVGQFFNIGRQQAMVIKNRALRKLHRFGFNLGYLKTITPDETLTPGQMETLLEKQNSVPDVRLLSRPVEHFVWDHLQNTGISYLGDLLIKTEEELLAIPGFETEDVAAVKSQLSAKGLHLGMSFLDWPSDPAQAEARVQELNPRPKINLTTLLAYPIERLNLFPDENLVVGFKMDSEIKEGLKKAGIIYLGDLIARTPEELLKIPGMGRAKLFQMEKKLTKWELQLGADIDWPTDRQQAEELVAKLNPRVEFSPVFTRSIKSLQFSSPEKATQITYILADNELSYLGDLAQMTPEEILRISGIGESRLIEIENALLEKGLRLGMNMDWPTNRQQVEELVTKWNPTENKRPILYESLKKLGLSTRLIGFFRMKGIIYLGDLTQMTPEEVLKVPEVGKAKLREIEKNLSEKGLHLDMNINWPSDRQQVDQMALEWGKNNPFTLRQPSRNLARSITISRFSKRVERVLLDNDIHYLGDLVIKTPEELLSLPNLGKTGLTEIESVLSEQDLEWGMPINWPKDREQVEKLVEELRFYRSQRQSRGFWNLEFF